MNNILSIFDLDEVKGMWFEYYNSIMSYKKYICKEWLFGVKKLSISDSFPDIHKLNKHLSDEVSLKLTKPIGKKEWFQMLSHGFFPVHSSVRCKDNLHHSDFPDFFHDILGHCPYLINSNYVESIISFAELYMLSNNIQRERLAKAWYYFHEFGVIKEGVDIKAYGAGLISSKAEIEQMISGNIELVGFEYGKLWKFRVTPEGNPEVLFLFNSLNDLIEKFNEVEYYAL